MDLDSENVWMNGIQLGSSMENYEMWGYVPSKVMATEMILHSIHRRSKQRTSLIPPYQSRAHRYPGGHFECCNFGDPVSKIT